MADISVIASDSTQSTSSAEIAAEPEDDTPMHSDETEATKDRARGKLTKTCNLTRLKLLAGLVPIVLYAVDVGSDVSLAVTYFLDGEWIYGGLTTAFCVFAYVTLVVMGVKFFNNYEEEQPRRRACRLFLVMLGLSPVVASVEYLRCRWKDLTPRRSDKKLLLKADYALMILRLLESFLEAAPQLCLQLYIVFKEKLQEKDVRAVLQIVAVFSSWVSLAMSAAMYRKFDPDDSDEALTTIPWYNRLLWFLWRLCETGGRVLCIALFASTFEYWVFVLLCCHYGIVLICACWAMKDKELGKFKAVAWGYVLLFCVPLPDQDARYVYSFYYVIFYAENFLMLGLWAGMTSDRDAWFYVPGIVTVMALFPLHFVMQLIYYKCSHPEAEENKCCKHCQWKDARKAMKTTFDNV
ncbi:hypothetical protein BaRGS_00002957 [Batillaria attramentaria]|uniref:XK-related protein n=1 Tax=Batillaria attramentaria TaxID=370345 RepID=A0ABD0M2H0_9CAEN